jgi:hypothetical protein
MNFIVVHMLSLQSVCKMFFINGLQTFKDLWNIMGGCKLPLWMLVQNKSYEYACLKQLQANCL